MSKHDKTANAVEEKAPTLVTCLSVKQGNFESTADFSVLNRIK